MNLKEVYEIFYPGKCKENPSVWNVPPKYRSKKDFFEELVYIVNMRLLSSEITPSPSFYLQEDKESKYIEIEMIRYECSAA
mgnify:CR=1 FL=1